MDWMCLTKVKLVLWCGLMAIAVVGCSSAKKNPPPPGQWIVQAGGPQAPMIQGMPPQGMPGAAPQGMSPQNAGQQQPQTILVQGNVKNHILGWTEDLTLAQALIDADYQGLTNPRTIVVIRQGQANMIDVNKFLRGKENPPLLPGDIIELRF
jgi:hypothetical protein